MLACRGLDDKSSFVADPVGVEVTQRTGRNPQYCYISLGCSHAAAQRMLAFARRQVGKPFSNAGMARSLIMPRQSDGNSWFCAELVAAILKEGQLMSSDSNPGAATPYSLYKLYSKQGAATANPYTLRAVGGLTFDSMVSPQARVALRPSASASGAPFAALRSHPALVAHPRAGQTADSLPPGFKVLSARGQGMGTPGITLSLNSLSSAPRS